MIDVRPLDCAAEDLVASEAPPERPRYAAQRAVAAENGRSPADFLLARARTQAAARQRGRPGPRELELEVCASL